MAHQHWRGRRFVKLPQPSREALTGGIGLPCQDGPRTIIAGMSRRDVVLVEHRRAIRAAAVNHNARSIALVGSVARGDDTDESDYDFLADFLPGTTLFDHAALELELEDILGSAVDVMPATAAKDRFPAMFDDAVQV